MGVQVVAQAVVSPRLHQAFAMMPVVVNEEMKSGMRDSTALAQRFVRVSIRAKGLVRTGNLLEQVSVSVTGDSASRLTTTGRVFMDIRGRHPAFYALALQSGAVVLPKRKKWLTFRIGGTVALIDQIGERKLKRARVETIGGSWVKVKRVVISPTNFFTDGANLALPEIERRLEEAADRAVDKVFGGE